MNTQEFKAWFEGFTEGMEFSPNERQWKRIKERVAEITPEPTTIRYFYDHYWPWRYTTLGGGCTYISAIGQNTAAAQAVPDKTQTFYCNETPLNYPNESISLTQFTALGRADATACSQN